MFYKCRDCGMESAVRKPRTYIGSDVKERLERHGWKVTEDGWKIEVRCQQCGAKA